jgi:hypothetical protein
MDFVLARSEAVPPGITAKLTRSCGLTPMDNSLMPEGSVTWPLLLRVAAGI